MKRGIILGLLAIAALVGPAGVAAAQSASAARSSAGALRELDIMLMVTSLRCRFGESDFQADYSQFAARHRASLGNANGALLADFARTHGATSAVGALDRLSISIANRYGNGHPWLDCGALKQVTRDLVALNHSDELEAHAAYLLGSGPEGAVQLAARR